MYRTATSHSWRRSKGEDGAGRNAAPSSAAASGGRTKGPAKDSARPPPQGEGICCVFELNSQLQLSSL